MNAPQLSLSVNERGDKMSFGERLLNRRKTLKVTQQSLAEALGVTPQHISLIEQDKATPSLNLVAGLAKELGVSTDYLISGQESIVSDTIPAIKADKRLSIKAKKALISLVEEFYSSGPPTPLINQ
jgi:transcriptional regulator with XRE-family HTH domain